MSRITFYKHEPVPVEMHRVKIVRPLTLLPVRERLEKIRGGVQHLCPAE